MNIAQAKQIPIETFLDKAGYKPASSKASDLWYRSPLREENTPSFKVNRILNTWFDFGLDQGGTIIDLVCVMFNESVKDALHRLDSDFITRKAYQTPAIQPQIKEQSENPLKLVRVEKLSKPALFCYLTDRGINLDIAKKYLKQIIFSIKGNDKEQFALGFENIQNGFEVRSQIFKGFVGNTKTISIINPSKTGKIAVFEGFLDFLSYLTDHNITDFESTAIILNSTAQQNRAKEHLTSIDFEKAYFFLDNDESGEKAFEFLSTSLPYPVINKSSVYAGFNDYNEYLMSKK
jgi:hypothetical protein